MGLNFLISRDGYVARGSRGRADTYMLEIKGRSGSRDKMRQRLNTPDVDGDACVFAGLVDTKDLSTVNSTCFE